MLLMFVISGVHTYYTLGKKYNASIKTVSSLRITFAILLPCCNVQKFQTPSGKFLCLLIPPDSLFSPNAMTFGHSAPALCVVCIVIQLCCLQAGIFSPVPPDLLPMSPVRELPPAVEAAF